MAEIYRRDEKKEKVKTKDATKRSKKYYQKTDIKDIVSDISSSIKDYDEGLRYRTAYGKGKKKKHRHDVISRVEKRKKDILRKK